MNINNDPGRTLSVVNQLNHAIRDNPLAAGLIGAGVAWMFLGTKGLGSFAGLAKGAAATTVGAAGSAGDAVSNGLRSASDVAVSAARGAASAVTDGVASIVPNMEEPHAGDVVSSAAAHATSSGELRSVASKSREYNQVLKSRLSEGLERQPLLLGAIGLAIGAGIASTFATTGVEADLIGERGTRVREVLTGAFDVAQERAGEVLSDLQHEASRQGLTLDAAKEAAAAVAGKVRTVVDSASAAATKPAAATTSSDAK